MSKPLLLLVSVWLLGCLTGLLYWSQAGLVPFDPDQRLLDWSLQPDFSEQLRDAFEARELETAAVAFHVSADGCFCDYVSAPHRSRLSQRLASQGFSNQPINLNAMPALRQFIPATPALVIFGRQGELFFAGPYAEGYGCLSGDGFLEALLRQPDAVPATGQVIALAAGCYCHQAPLNEPRIETTPTLTDT